MSAEQLIAEFKALSMAERQQVAEAIMEDESWIPESFREGMEDLERGRTVAMEAALTQVPPPSVA
jgi:predicted transcriptional regulator